MIHYKNKNTKPKATRREKNIYISDQTPNTNLNTLPTFHEQIPYDIMDL